MLYDDNFCWLISSQTGGQDDLCTVYAPLEQRLVARCQGHSSFVTGVAWDPWRSDETTLRFGSVSEDCKLILWDLSSAALSRPKTHHVSFDSSSLFHGSSASLLFVLLFLILGHLQSSTFHFLLSFTSSTSTGRSTKWRWTGSNCSSFISSCTT